MPQIELEMSEEFIPDLLSRRKVCTTRRSIHGKRGDTFTLSTKDGRDYQFRINTVISTTLKKAIDEYHYLDGFETPKDMFNWWIQNYKIENIYEFASNYHKQKAFIHFISPD
ncbi:MAG: hypothetical protein PHQ97_15130 [Desulfobacterales bacterium]|nr:hypothetical protein [Desulfobacterales bacterium]